MKRRSWYALLVALSVATGSAFGASSAQADTYVCTFTGAAGPFTDYNGEAANGENGVESVSTDALQGNEGDGTNVMDDTDDGDGSAAPGGEDGEYVFTTAAGGNARCLFVENVGGPAEQPGHVTGAYNTTITSFGEYNNVVCGTGYAIDDDIHQNGGGELTNVAGPAGFADITDADYRIDFSASAGPIDITDADNVDGESGAGRAVDGKVSIQPTAGNCGNQDVTAFQATGSFGISTR